jgi:hypothetical protein
MTGVASRSMRWLQSRGEYSCSPAVSCTEVACPHERALNRDSRYPSNSRVPADSIKGEFRDNVNQSRFDCWVGRRDVDYVGKLTGWERLYSTIYAASSFTRYFLSLAGWSCPQQTSCTGAASRHANVWKPGAVLRSSFSIRANSLSCCRCRKSEYGFAGELRGQLCHRMQSVPCQVCVMTRRRHSTAFFSEMRDATNATKPN